MEDAEVLFYVLIGGVLLFFALWLNSNFDSIGG
jgi:hypothetical protein